MVGLKSSESAGNVMHSAMRLDQMDESLWMSSSVYVSGTKVRTRHFSCDVYVLARIVLVEVNIHV